MKISKMTRAATGWTVVIALLLAANLPATTASAAELPAIAASAGDLLVTAEPAAAFPAAAAPAASPAAAIRTSAALSVAPASTDGAPGAAAAASLAAASFRSPPEVRALSLRPAAEGTEAKLRAAAAGWMNRLAREPAFAEWKDATAEIAPLGPGTHAWLATVSNNGKPVGYMVIYAAEDGSYRLGEYGAGPQPLFDAAALRRSLEENGLISASQARAESYRAVRHYFHPFAAMWEARVGSETYWLDAKTGELLPIGVSGWDELRRKLTADAASYVPGASPDPKAASGRFVLNETFDPYERLPWLMNESPFDGADDAKVKTRLEQSGHLRFVVSPFGESMLYAQPVVGYHQWSPQRLDLAIDMNGIRFIPADTLKKLGLFYL